MSAVVPGWSPSLVPLVIVAGAMVGVNLYLLTRAFPRDRVSPHLGTVVLVVGLLAMSAVLWLALIDAILDPGDASTVAVFIAGNSMMGVFGAWIIAVMYRAEERRLPNHGWGWPAAFALLVVGSELLMGAAYVLATAGTLPYVDGSPAGVAALVRDAVGSVWFSGAMLANMTLLLVWLPLPATERRALAGLAASAGLCPWVVAGSPVALVAMGGLMTAVLGVGLYDLARGPSTHGAVRTVGGVGVAFGVMMASGLGGVAIGGDAGGAFPFAIATALVMAGEVGYLGRWALGRSGAVPGVDPPVAPDASGPAVVGS